MNKKLFTLLTSAAMMAAMAPSVFAETMEMKLSKNGETADGKIIYDVTVKANRGITGLQWYFKSNGGLGTNDSYDIDDVETAGWHVDDDGLMELFKRGGDLAYTPELHKMPGFEDKATESDNYQVAGAAQAKKVGDPSEGIKIGTVVVEKAADGETWVDVNVDKSKATYTDDTNEVALFDWKIVTDGPVDDSKADESVADESKAEESSAADESKAEESSAADESKAEESSAADSSAADSSAADSSAADSSTAPAGDSSKGGSDGSPDTGVASTAVVALAAASAALVVVSKKRK